MHLSIWVPDWLVRGIVFPALVVSSLEIPFLVGYFSGINPRDLFPYVITGEVSVSGGFLIVLLASLFFVVGYVARDTQRAIKIVTLSQFTAFSLSMIPVFMYPVTSQAVLALTQCAGGCVRMYNDQLISGMYVFFAGFAILVLLVSIVSAGLGSLIGERLVRRTRD